MGLFAITAITMLTVDDALVDFLDSLHLPIPAGDHQLLVWKLFTVAALVAIAFWIGISYKEDPHRAIEIPFPQRDLHLKSG